VTDLEKKNIELELRCQDLKYAQAVAPPIPPPIRERTEFVPEYRREREELVDMGMRAGTIYTDVNKQ
jgi:hypothetical protein